MSDPARGAPPSAPLDPTAPLAARPLPSPWIGWLLFAAAFLSLLLTESTVGFVRDESVYFAAGESYAGWYRLLFKAPAVALSDAGIVRSWDFNHEHPALAKTLFGLSHWVFHQALGWLRPAAAFRLPAFLFAALIPLLLYRMGARLFGRGAAVFAALSFLLVPRQFFHSHLAAFDVPVATLWLLTVYAFWRAQAARRGWLWAGLAFGLALATKHNALFLPFVLAPFALWRAYRAVGDDAPGRAALDRFLWVLAGGVTLLAVLYGLLGPQRFQAKFLLLSPHTLLAVATLAGSGVFLERLRATHPVAFRAVAPLWAMAVIGPVVFYLSWPYLWHHPVDRTAWWLAFHAQHNHYTWFYLGELLREPPFPLAYVVVKTALTVPAALFVPMALGFAALTARVVATAVPRWRGRLGAASWEEALVLLNAVVSIAIISHPDVPHFGGVKHWFPSMPFLALLAGVSVARAASLLDAWLRPRWPKLPAQAAMAALSLLLFSSAAIATARVHPYGTSAYGEFAGGVPGAASLGMQRQYWSNNVTGVLPWINEHAAPNARVYLHEVNGFSFRDYQRNGLLRSDLRASGGPHDADVAAYQYHQEFREQEMDIWQAFGTRRPAHGLYLDETPQVLVYRRR